MPQYRVKDAMCALELRGNEQVVTQLPAGIVLEPQPTRTGIVGMVRVLSGEQIYSVFEWDLAHKADVVLSTSAGPK